MFEMLKLIIIIIIIIIDILSIENTVHSLSFLIFDRTGTETCLTTDWRRELKDFTNQIN